MVGRPSTMVTRRGNSRDAPQSDVDPSSLAAARVVLRGATVAERSPLEPTLRLVGFVAFFIAAPGLAFLHGSAPTVLPAGEGGILGQLVGGSLLHSFGPLGAGLFLLALVLVAITLATGLSWFRLMDSIGQLLLGAGTGMANRMRKAGDWSAAREAPGSLLINGCVPPTPIWTGTRSPPATLTETLNSPKSRSRGSGSLAVSAAGPTCSSPTSCSSARTYPGPGYRRALSSSTARTLCSCPGPR
jgi:hypothetical protein